MSREIIVIIDQMLGGRIDDSQITEGIIRVPSREIAEQYRARV